MKNNTVAYQFGIQGSGKLNFLRADTMYSFLFQRTHSHAGTTTGIHQLFLGSAICQRDLHPESRLQVSDKKLVYSDEEQFKKQVLLVNKPVIIF